MENLQKMFYFIETIFSKYIEIMGDVENLIIPLYIYYYVASNSINFVLIGEIPHPFLTQFRINKYIKSAPVLYSYVFFRLHNKQKEMNLSR